MLIIPATENCPANRSGIESTQLGRLRYPAYSQDIGGSPVVDSLGLGNGHHLFE
jgi:hypothetical protein